VTEYIYHIATSASWSAAQPAGQYTPDSLATQGFIHCSKVDQILRVANNYYSGQTGLVILEIDPTRLEPGLSWEPGADKTDELFPHLYSPLNLGAVKRVVDFVPASGGKFSLPPSIGKIDK
jgi:uncharacterized protein (DUF952 family)